MAEYDWRSLNIEAVTPEGASELMKQAGLRMTPERIRKGLDQGVLPFGEGVRLAGKRPSYRIYVNQLWQWCKDRDVGGGERDDRVEN